MCEVGGGDFVDDADHGFGPGGVVVCRLLGRGRGEKGGFLRWCGGRWRGRFRGVAVGGVGETGFCVGHAGEVEGHD